MLPVMSESTNNIINDTTPLATCISYLCPHSLRANAANSQHDIWNEHRGRQVIQPVVTLTASVVDPCSVGFQNFYRQWSEGCCLWCIASFATFDLWQWWSQPAFLITCDSVDWDSLTHYRPTCLLVKLFCLKVPVFITSFLTNRSQATELGVGFHHLSSTHAAHKPVSHTSIGPTLFTMSAYDPNKAT